MQYLARPQHALRKSELPVSEEPYFFYRSVFFFLINLFILFYFWLHWVFIAAHGLFSGCSEQGLLFVEVCGLLIAVASLVAEHEL